MENRVRDLEQLQEQDPESRKRGSLAMAALSILAIAFAIGLVVGKAAMPEAPERDPLDQLDRVAEATRREAATSPQPAAAKVEAATDANSEKKAQPPAAVEPSQLTFERSLTGVDERPEVIAALEAAGREEERMAIHTAAPTARAPEEHADYDIGGLEADEEPVPLGNNGAPPVVPAGLTAGLGQKLEKAKAHDRLIAAALPKGSNGKPAARGSEGEFTLQVISYDSQPAAEAFASALRARGHEAFVTIGEVEGRGRYYRVRVGPFKTKASADEYRRAFEQRERMNTIVVKRAAQKN